MQFKLAKAEVHVPDGTEESPAVERVTHMGVVAHQDDLEILAYHGIASCYRSSESWFGGVVCTDGAGSPRTGPYSGTPDHEMTRIRRSEQRCAADIGRYAMVAQLGYPSAPLKEGRTESLAADLLQLLEVAQPQVLYTHNPADKHETHVAVFKAVLQACRKLPAGRRPRRLLGCEGWRNLDWLDDDNKIILDCSPEPHLAAALIGVFDSQISGGKRYELAAPGRWRANATFHDPRQTDYLSAAVYAMDLTPLILDDEIDPADFVCDQIRRFCSEVHTNLAAEF